jgi:hypothetical protein
VDAPVCAELDGDVDIERDGNDEEEGDKDDGDEEEEHKKEEGEVVENEEEEIEDEENEEEDEDNSNEPWTISQAQMGNTSDDNVETMVGDQAIMLPDEGQMMSEPTAQQQPLAPAPWPQTMQPRPQARTPKTDSLTGLQDLGMVTLQKPHMAVPNLQEAKAAGNPSDVDVNRQLLGETAGGDRDTDGPLPDFLLPDVAHREANVDCS